MADAPHSGGVNPTAADLGAAARRGDPVGDALARAAATDPTVWSQLGPALAPGARAGHPAVAAFVDDLARTTSLADDFTLDRAARSTFTVPLGAHAFDVGAGALLRSYAPPWPAAVLVGTGALVDDTDRRLLNTSRWLVETSLPGGLRPGRPGLAATARVRLAHAVARTRFHRAHPTEVPLSQFDLVRTWLDFTVVAPDCARTLGFGQTEREYADFLTHWRHLGALLGIEPALIAGAVDGPSAHALDDLVASLTGPPSPDSRTLTRAGLGALARGLADVSPLPLALTHVLVRTTARALHGADLARALGIPSYGPAHRAVDVFAALVRRRRTALRRDPVAWEAMVARNVRANEEFLGAGLSDGDLDRVDVASPP